MGIKVKDILFYYNPNIEEFTIFSGLKFTNQGGKEFEVDLNPHGQYNLVKIDSLDVDIDKKSLSCRIEDDNTETNIMIKFEINLLGFKTVSDVNFNFNSKNDLDKIDIFFEGDKFMHLYLSKVQDYEIIDSMRIIFEEGKYFVVKNKPKFIRESLKTFSLEENIISVQGDENDYQYQLDIDGNILNLLQNIFKLVKV